MKGAVFEEREITLWKEIFDEVDRRNKKPPFYNITPEKYRIEIFNFILSTLKSYRLSPNGNGIKWSKEEKQKFITLSYKEQRKMIVKKSELKSTLFPYVNVDYEPYKYSDRISDTAKKTYEKANKILESKKKIDFNNLDSKTQQEILHNLRLSYNERYFKAGVELSKLLFKKAHLSGSSQSKKEMYECVRLVKELLNEKIPEISYMYYQLYKWSIDDDRIFNTTLTPQELGLTREEALECYNYALESIVWEAIDEEAQKEENAKSAYAAELYLAAAIKHQSPLGFYLAAQNYSPSDIFPNTAFCSLIMYHACLRCSIALGGGGIGDIIDCYSMGIDFSKSPFKANRLRNYNKKTNIQKGLINGLDPYFDEKFPPDMIIDFTLMCDNLMYGAIKLDNNKWMGISWAINKGYVKDPRSKNATLDSIKEYYLMMWKIIVQQNKKLIYQATINPLTIIGKKIYQNLIPYGPPSARPYIFPKEVLDLQIDFNKGF